MTQHQSNEDSLTPVVTVKPLEWLVWSKNSNDARAVTPWGVYYVEGHARKADAYLSFANKGLGSFPSFLSAKEAAQSDLESRVASILITPDASQAYLAGSLSKLVDRCETLVNAVTMNDTEALRLCSLTIANVVRDARDELLLLRQQAPRSGYSQTTEVREITEEESNK